MLCQGSLLLMGGIMWASGQRGRFLEQSEPETKQGGIKCQGDIGCSATQGLGYLK